MTKKARPKWTGDLIGCMHNNNVDAADLAKELDVSAGYISMILNGYRSPKNAEQRLNEALCSILAMRE